MPPPKKTVKFKETPPPGGNPYKQIMPGQQPAKPKRTPSEIREAQRQWMNNSNSTAARMTRSGSRYGDAGEQMAELSTAAMDEVASAKQEGRPMALGAVAGAAIAGGLTAAGAKRMMKPSTTGAVTKAVTKASTTSLSPIAKVNPWAKGNVLNKWDGDSNYRIINGQAAIDDIAESGLIRTNSASKKGISTDTSIPLSQRFLSAERPTAYPSFAKGKPAMSYADKSGPHAIIETKRPIAVSTMGRHGKGTTQFPVDENGKYLKEFSASEAKVYKPHWLKGYTEDKSLSQVPMTSLYRIQGKDAKPFAQLAQEGKVHKAFNTPSVLERKANEEKHFGQWFTNDIEDINWYRKDREFTKDNSDLIELSVPTSELSKYKNYDQSLSRAPDREFVIPQEFHDKYKVKQYKEGTMGIKMGPGKGDVKASASKKDKAARAKALDAAAAAKGRTQSATQTTNAMTDVNRGKQNLAMSKRQSSAGSTYKAPSTMPIDGAPVEEGKVNSIASYGKGTRGIKMKKKAK
jgi:hypothetical protein